MVRAVVIDNVPATKGLAGYRRVREYTSGRVHTLINGSPNRTVADVGDNGRIEWLSSGSLHLPVFVPDNKE